MKKKIVSLIAAFTMAVAGASALPASAYVTSKTSPGIYYLREDSKETDSNAVPASTSRTLRKGYYTGYQVNGRVIAVATGYGYKKVPRSKTVLWYNSSKYNSINTTGAYSQLSGENLTGGYYNGYPYGCGPTSASALITWELSKPYNNTYVTNKKIINYYKKNPTKAKGFLFDGSIKHWCLSNGTTNVGVKRIIKNYASQYGSDAANVVMKDPLKLVTASKVMKYIDARLAEGHRVLVTVRLSSHESKTGTVSSYIKSGGATHYVVIAAETGGSNGNYFVSDPWYNEGTRYSENGLNYYYGLQTSSKSTLALSMLNAGGDYERSLIYVK